MAPLATVGRILLQFIIPDGTSGNAIRRGVWSRIASFISISVGHGSSGHRGAPAV
jgi:hypothetical protein